MGGRLAKPDPRIDHDPLTGNAGLLQGVDPRSQVRGDFTQHVVIVGILLHRGGRPLHVHANDAGPGSAQTEAIAGSNVRPDTSLTMTAPASSARRATSAFVVSIERGHRFLRLARSPEGPAATPRRSERGSLLAGSIPHRYRGGRPPWQQLGSVIGRAARVKILAAIGEAVRGDIHDSHDLWEIAQLPRRFGKAPAEADFVLHQIETVYLGTLGY